MSHESTQQMIAPPSLQSGGNVSNQNQYRSGESKESYIQSVQQSRTVRATVGQVVQTRAQFVALLANYRLGLVTSAREFDTTGDFVRSSYIVHLDHNSQREPLDAFCDRYPDFIPHAHAVAQLLTHLKGQNNFKNT